MISILTLVKISYDSISIGTDENLLYKYIYINNAVAPGNRDLDTLSFETRTYYNL